mmetsp:Transcript_54458/g.145286  ORF Transcript_54458/g.145286 Transcript_54458/m.145286 type:complete len:209 (-) Transcript_54458:629-1255(-)
MDDGRYIGEAVAVQPLRLQAKESNCLILPVQACSCMFLQERGVESTGQSFMSCVSTQNRNCFRYGIELLVACLVPFLPLLVRHRTLSVEIRKERLIRRQLVVDIFKIFPVVGKGHVHVCRRCLLGFELSLRSLHLVLFRFLELFEVFQVRCLLHPAVKQVFGESRGHLFQDSVNLSRLRGVFWHVGRIIWILHETRYGIPLRAGEDAL